MKYMYRTDAGQDDLSGIIVLIGGDFLVLCLVCQEITTWK